MSSRLFFSLAPIALLVACSHEAPPPAPIRPTPTVAVAAPEPSASAAPVPSASAEAAPACAPLVDLPDIVSVDADPPVPAIEDPTGAALTRFYEHLAALVRGTATDHVRIAMYGDSNLVTDFITGEMRRVFQKKFGDGGHGFVAIAKPWNSYHHMDVRHENTPGSWSGYSVSSWSAPDGIEGLGLVAAQSRVMGASAWVSTADDSAPIGKTVSRFDVFYLKRPGFGSFEVKIDGEVKATVDTDAPEPVAAFETIDVPDGPHKAVFTATTMKPVRFFGVALERKKPSVVVDSFGAVSLTVQQMATRNDAKVFKDTLAHRNYDLVLYMTGTNEWFGPVKHKEYIERLIGLHREATPDVSIMFMSPPDRADNIHSNESTWSIKRVGSEKREFSLGDKAAFWDFRQAMGGEVSIIRFRGQMMCGQDLVHFTEKGFYMGDRLASALWRGFREWLVKHPDAGCAPTLH